MTWPAWASQHRHRQPSTASDRIRDMTTSRTGAMFPGPVVLYHGEWGSKRIGGEDS